MFEIIFVIWALLCPNPPACDHAGTQMTTMSTGGETGPIPPTPPKK